MKKQFFILVFLFFAIQLFSQDYCKYVNPFIGTGGHGHTFPGPTVPFGMVQLSPDTDLNGWDWASGYHASDSSILGFSHTHISGTGVGDLGDLLLLPRTGKLVLNRGNKKNIIGSYRTPFSHKDEVAKPGYYSVLLKHFGIKAELTATAHCGFHKYTFPKSDSSYILIDPTTGIGNNTTAWTKLKIENDSTISGMILTFGWVPFQYVYFVMKFSKPFQKYQLTAKPENPGWNNREIETKTCWGSVHFKTSENETVLVKVGISAVSNKNALENLNTEIKDWDFNSVSQNAYQQWNKELSKVQITADQKQLNIFYTGLYHALIQPNNIADVNGQYRGVDYEIATSENKKYYSTFSLWDTYRAAHPLYSLLYPQRDAEFVMSMLSHHQKQGFLPIWTLWGGENYCMIANHAIPVIVDAYFKGLVKSEDIQKAYQAIKETSINNHRGSYWDIYNKYGYYPTDLVIKESVSKTLEISYNDWCVAQMAKKLGYKEDYTFFYNRSLNYRNLHDSVSGFFRARNADSTWMKDFNPINIMHSHGYTEANAWQYYWYVPQNVDDLIKLTGGKKKFTDKLDSLFAMSSKIEGKLSDVTGFIGQYVHGNEPSHHVAYLYAYAGQPWKTQKRIAQIANEMYRAEPDGYAGNEDCGQMSAWYILSSMGFYPVNPANSVYVFGTPLVNSAILNFDNGIQFKIIAKNLSSTNYYIQAVFLNGKQISKLWISHKEIINGGTLEFIMGNKPNVERGKNKEDYPPNDAF